MEAQSEGADASGLEPSVRRELKSVFSRRSADEQLLRRAMVAELVRQAPPAAQSGDRGRAEPPRRLEGLAPAPPAEAGAPRATLPPGAAAHAASSRNAAPPKEGPIRFAASFECGNLLSAKLAVPHPSKGAGAAAAAAAAAAAESSGGCEWQRQCCGGEKELEYDLCIESDTQSPAGHMQWFYFSISTFDFQGIIHFRIVNLRKKKSLYQMGMQPQVYSVRRNRGWESSVCENVSYCSNATVAGRWKSADAKSDMHTLAFSYRVAFKNDEVYFASYPPYTFSMLQNFIARLESDSSAQENFMISEISRSIGQLPLLCLVISQGMGLGREGVAASAGPPGPPAGPKPAIAVIARQHPGEVVGSWAVQGLVKFLLGPTPAAVRLREAYCFHIVPMVNVDGVVYGNARCSLAGVDPNRIWHDPNPVIHPEVFALKSHLRKLAQGEAVPGGICQGMELFIDFHGHSARSGCFFYGCSPTAPVSNALFPKLCALGTRDITFEKCNWRCPRTHKRTARYVVYKTFNVRHCFTMECSFFGPTPAPCPRPAEGDPTSPGQVHLAGAVRRAAPDGPGVGSFTPSRVEWIGCAVGFASAAFLAGAAAPPAAAAEEELARKHPEREGGGDPHFLPDLSRADVLARRPWLTLQLLEATTCAEVLAGLAAAYGDHVPDFGRRGGEGSEEEAGSDGDAEEAEGAEGEGGAEAGQDESLAETLPRTASAATALHPAASPAAPARGLAVSAGPGGRRQHALQPQPPPPRPAVAAAAPSRSATASKKLAGVADTASKKLTARARHTEAGPERLAERAASGLTARGSGFAAVRGKAAT